MPALVIGGAEQQAAIAELIKLAELNVMPLAEVEALSSSPLEVQRCAAAGNRLQTIKLPVGYNATYTHETQPEAICRHLSVSVDRRGKLPSIEAVQAIMLLFHFVNEIRGCFVWIEGMADHQQAINVVEPLDGDMGKLKKK